MRPIDRVLQFIPKNIRKWVTNKYILASAIFLFWFIGCDQYSLVTQLRLSKTVKQLEYDKTFYQQQIERAWQEKRDLEKNTDKYAREKYYMSKENEEIFVFPEKEE